MTRQSLLLFTLVLSTAVLYRYVEGFQSISSSRSICSRSSGSASVPPNAASMTTTTTTLFMGKKRMAKRTQKVEKQSRPPTFFDAMEDAMDNSIKPLRQQPELAREKSDDDDKAVKEADLEREKRAAEAQARMDQRPDVSTMIIDEETGMELVVQGKSVMDVITRKAVQLSNRGPAYRMAQMFPGVPPAVRAQYRLDWNTATAAQIVDALYETTRVTLPDGTRDIPPHPSVSNKAIDFVLANRDQLGHKMKRTLGRMQMRAMSLGDKDEARRLNKLWKNFLTLENHISAPFRQIIMDAEGRVGPNFGNLDLLSYCNGDLYERTANYLVLKGMVANWEKKVIDADYVERTPQTKDNYIRVLSRGDPKRYLPDPPILFTLRECTQVCAMSQQMTKAFVETPQLFDDLPPEVRFIERALTIQGGAALREFASRDFCPAEDITPEGLREGLRRLATQLDNMQIDPYADLTNILEKLVNALSLGTDDERDPYVEVLVSTQPNDPGYFQTYTFNHEKLSLVRFLDSQYERTRTGGDSVGGMTMGGGPVDAAGNNPLEALFANMGQPTPTALQPAVKEPQPGTEDEDIYRVPIERANGRPHNLGWLDLLADDEQDASMRMGKVPAGKIVMED